LKDSKHWKTLCHSDAFLLETARSIGILTWHLSQNGTMFLIQTGETDDRPPADRNVEAGGDVHAGQWLSSDA